MRPNHSIRNTFFITLCLFSFTALDGPSLAVTFPITYEGTVHVTASVSYPPPYGSGSCEGDAKMKITLLASGELRETTDAIVSTPGPNKTACEIKSLESIGDPWRTHEGTHDMAGAFSFTMHFVSVSGTFDDHQITGTGSGSEGYLSIQYSFTLPALTSCPANQKIPLPTGQQVFAHEAPAIPGLGMTASAIRPLGVGALAGNPKGSATLKLGLCPFEGPVDIYLAYVDSAFQMYVLGADGKIKDVEHLQPWKTNVTTAVNENLGDFGGLFPDPGRLPKGANSFFVLAAPSGGALSGFYLWVVTTDASCPEPFPSLPDGPNFYFYEPVAVPVYSSDPAKMKPLAIGPAAIGGKTAAITADFCNFGYVDVHFATYCADDPEALYFLNFSGKTPEEAAWEDILQGMNLSDFVGFPSPFERNNLLDEAQNTQTAFFVGPTNDLPKPVCIYLVAVTPPNSPLPADKFYAWGTIVHFDITRALNEFWWAHLHP